MKIHQKITETPLNVSWTGIGEKADRAFENLLPAVITNTDEGWLWGILNLLDPAEIDGGGFISAAFSNKESSKHRFEALKKSKAVLLIYPLTIVHQLFKKNPKNPRASQDFPRAVGCEQEGGQEPCAVPWRVHLASAGAGHELQPPQDSWQSAETSCPSQKQRAAELLSSLWI